MFGIDFDNYTLDELIQAKAMFVMMVKLLTGECKSKADTCKGCKYFTLCHDCFAACLNIDKTVANKT